MLESLINPKKAERKPYEMLFIGILYSSLAVLVADFLFLKNPVFEKHVTLFIVFFTVLFSLPFFYYLIRLEEQKDEKIKKESKLLKEHGKAVSALLFLFLGYLIAFSFLYLVFPRETSNLNFKSQIETYCAVNAQDITSCVNSYTTGNIIGITSSTIPTGLTFKDSMLRLSSILSNNFFVLIVTLIFSLIFGAGAIFILTWNASVIALAIGIFSKNLSSLPLGFLRFMIHGLPEIASYFIVALAGGIIGSAVIKHEFNKKKFWHILLDSLDMIILALVVLIVAALIEVFITPQFF